MASKGKDLMPANFGGVGRQIERGAEDPTHGGLAGVCFSSQCPPDVQPNTRVVAVCGITDYHGTLDYVSSSEEEEEISARKNPRFGVLDKTLQQTKDIFSATKRREKKDAKKLAKQKAAPTGLAAPQEDGWFLSDFYLFHHLFRGLFSNQLRLTCESPKVLVERYGEYAHGEPSGDHRVVLDESMLPELKAHNNIRVSKRSELLEDFIGNFRSECKIAAAKHQSVLLLVFGHGDMKTHGIGIGGERPDRVPRLSIRHIVSATKNLDISVTIMLTSCYSGGWVYQPSLNISALTAAGPEDPSHAWDSSIGGRSHGSVYATAVRQAFMKMEDQKATQTNPYATGTVEDGEDYDESSTFAELTNVIHETLLYDVDLDGSRHGIKFAAQDDRWAQEWRQRSGIQLGEFQARWESLKQLPAQNGRQTIGPSSLEEVSGPSPGEENVKGPYGTHRKLNKYQAQLAVQELCRTYMSSSPGANNAGGNLTTHRHAIQLAKGEKIPAYQIDELHNVLAFRMELMKLATECKNMVGVGFIDCHEFDYETWDRDNRASSMRDKYEEYRHLIIVKDTFPDPSPKQGFSYMKPHNYLAAAFVDCELNAQAVHEALAKILADKHTRVTALTNRVRYDRSVRQTASKAFSTLGKRLRSPSPRKRALIPSFG